MPFVIEPWLLVGVGVVAVAYSMVGHGGASGYLALLTFTGFSHALSSTTALVLNVAVAGITFVAFQRAKHFDWRLAWPFLLGSVPMAFLGGRLPLHSRTQDIVLAATLLYAAFALAFRPEPGSEERRPPHPALAAGAGAGIGFLSGMVGVGGGIFLSPLMILCRWASPHTVASVSAAFIFLNSLAGLAARPATVIQESLTLWPLVVVGAAGAIAGSFLGARKVSPVGLRRALAAILLLAVWKLVAK